MSVLGWLGGGVAYRITSVTLWNANILSFLRMQNLSHLGIQIFVMRIGMQNLSRLGMQISVTLWD